MKPKTDQILRDAQPTLLPLIKSRVKGAYEAESLHVVSQSPLLCVCFLTSKTCIFQRKNASEEQSGQTEKHKLPEMLDQLCFQ